MFTYGFTTGLNASGNQVTSSESFTYGSRHETDTVVAIAASNFLETIAIDISEIEFLYIISNVDITLETDNSTTPQETINLKAGKPLIWEPGSYFACPFAGDVVAIYYTNGSGQQATVKKRILYTA